jgi:hypothetical protein
MKKIVRWLAASVIGAGSLIFHALTINGCLKANEDGMSWADKDLLKERKIPQEKVAPFIKQGFSLSESMILVDDKADANKTSPYFYVYKKHKLALFELKRLSQKGISPEIADKVLSFGFSSYDLETILNKKIPIQEAARYRKAGCSLYETSDLIESNIPLDYYSKRKDYLSCYEIEKVINSPFRDSKISTKSAKELYGDNVNYYDFGKLDFSGNEEIVELPKDLVKMMALRNMGPRIRNPDKFRSQVLETASSIGYKEEDFKNLVARAAIMAAVKIVDKKIKYFDVDGDANFTKKYGEHLPHDEYFDIGEGDCDKYSALTQAIFQMIKEGNPHLNNVYVASSIFGNPQLHEWNTVFVARKDRLDFSQIDPTRYQVGKFEASDELIDKKNFRIKLYKFIEEMRR